ncbi:MAG: hypothetical protein AAF585_07555 [Verrucomicrobiota bacterium]
MHGLVQTLPQERIACVKKMNRALMYSSASFGLNAQSIGDIATYLKTVKTES